MAKNKEKIKDEEIIEEEIIEEEIIDEEVKEEKENYLRQERSSGEVMRRFFVEDVDEDAIDAEFKDGVLKIVLPKKEKVVAEKKVINIK